MRREKKVVAKRVCLDFSIEMFSGGENAPVHLCCQKRNKQYELFWDQKKYLTVNIWHQNANPEQESLRHSVGTSYSSCLEEPFINGFMVLPSTGTTEGCRLVLNAEKKNSGRRWMQIRCFTLLSRIEHFWIWNPKRGSGFVLSYWRDVHLCREESV